MSSSVFFILNGRNGARYILNASTWSDLKFSFDFYRAFSFKQKVFKFFFQLFVYVSCYLSRLFSFSTFKSTNQIKVYFVDMGFGNVDFDVDTGCSALISPTSDKVIVHHHNSYFQKFAFDKSYSNVKREAQIYKLLGKTADSFSVSDFYDYVDDGTYCSFKMAPKKNNRIDTVLLADLLTPLSDFFCSVDNEQILSSQILANLKSDLDDLKFNNADIATSLSFIITKCQGLAEYKIPMGLVHGDFKPWNILYTFPLTIFDFEEANISGLPLEDYLNFIVDPIVRYKSAEHLAAEVFATSTIAYYNEYLINIRCDIDYIVLVYLYLLGRVLYWKKQGQEDTAECYFLLLKYIESSRYKLDV